MKKLQNIALVLGCVAFMGIGSAEASHYYCEEGGAGCVVPARQVCEPRPDMTRQSCRPQRDSWAALEVNQDKLRAPSMLRMSGTITEITGNKVVIRGEGQECVVAIIGDNTKIVKGAKGKLRSAKELKPGQRVMVYYSARMTRSLPPQAQAYAIVIGDMRKEYLPHYFVVDKVQSASDGSCVRVLNSTNDVIARIDKYACEDYASIKEGDELLLWSRIMTMSLPGQTNAEKVIVLK